MSLFPAEKTQTYCTGAPPTQLIAGPRSDSMKRTSIDPVMCLDRNIRRAGRARIDAVIVNVTSLFAPAPGGLLFVTESQLRRQWHVVAATPYRSHRLGRAAVQPTP